jgi:imidazole glycerol-phosphate synthase subunit HisH
MMITNGGGKVAIVDYGMGNLFSVKHACIKVGLNAEITNQAKVIKNSNGIILPGVGAFGDAITALRKLDLIDILRETSLSKPFMAICLGMQLLMERSYEFGIHDGLGIIKGEVVRFDSPRDTTGKILKVPHIGWNGIFRGQDRAGLDKWQNTALDGLENGEFMYFVHSYHVKPENSNLELSSSTYGDILFCSSLSIGHLFACQFHPERSGVAGLKIYDNFKHSIDQCGD